MGFMVFYINSKKSRFTIGSNDYYTKADILKEKRVICK